MYVFIGYDIFISLSVGLFKAKAEEILSDVFPLDNKYSKCWLLSH